MMREYKIRESGLYDCEFIVITDREYGSGANSGLGIDMCTGKI